jgi:hypothetical protein
MSRWAADSISREQHSPHFQLLRRFFLATLHSPFFARARVMDRWRLAYPGMQHFLHELIRFDPSVVSHTVRKRRCSMAFVLEWIVPRRVGQ